MSARWDEAAPGYRRDRWRLAALTLISLDLADTIAAELALDPGALAAARAEVRGALAGPFAARLADPEASLPIDTILAALGPPARALVDDLHDGVIRYGEGEPNALFCWGILLTRAARDEAAWASLGLPPPLADDLRTSHRWDDIQDRVDEALARPFSTWDKQVAVLGLFPPLDEEIGLGDGLLVEPAKTARKLGFWARVGARLGDAGLRELHGKAHAFLAAQPDLQRGCPRLHDPRLLAHPVLTAPDGVEQPEA